MKNLKKFSKNLVEELVNRLHHYDSYHDMETLHQIRVDVKKLKAVISLVSYGNKKFKGHQAFIPFRNIFRKAGAVREPEVLKKLLTRQSVRKQKADQGILTPAMVVFLDNIPFFIKSIKKGWKKIQPKLDGISKKDFKRFFKQKLDEIKVQLIPKPNMKEIHRTRKAIKTMLYLSKIKDKLSEEDKTFYADLEEIIGQWHDKQVLLIILKNGNAKADKRKLKGLRASCDSDKKKITKLSSEYFGASQA